MRRAITLSILVLLAAAGQPRRAGAQTGRAALTPPLLEGPSFALTGGVQTWHLGSLEDALSARHEALSGTGFSFEDASFPWAPAFGAELSYRFRGGWLVRATGEWARFRWDDRDGRSLRYLGHDRNFVSVGTTARVETNFLLGSFGIGRVRPWRGAAFGWTVSGIVAPVVVEDTIENTVNAEGSAAQRDVTSTGVGLGGEAALSVDYPAASSQTIFLELFYRNGSTEVELEEPAWNSSLVPGSRQIEFTGWGLRLGMRWS